MTYKQKVITDYNRALDKFLEILAMKKNEVVRDATIKRFELLFDITWKTLKVVLEEEKGVVCKSPKECIRSAYQNEIIDNDTRWLQIVDVRNFLAHTYNEDMANKNYTFIKNTEDLFLSLKESLAKYE